VSIRVYLIQSILELQLEVGCLGAEMTNQQLGGLVFIIVGFIYLVFSSPIARHLSKIDKTLFGAKISLKLYEKINVIVGLIFALMGALGLIGLF
jgi:uncharacterized protein YacL